MYCDRCGTLLPEGSRFCPKCGRPFIPGTNICPFCRNSKEVYMKLWGLTRGLRWMLFFPLFVSVISLAIQFILPAIQRVAVNDYITNESIYPLGSFMEDPHKRAFLLISCPLDQRLTFRCAGEFLANALSVFVPPIAAVDDDRCGLFSLPARRHGLFP